MMKYYGLTHALPLWLLPMWRLIMCRRNCHVFDEIESSYEHILICDACELVIHIERIEEPVDGLV